MSKAGIQKNVHIHFAKDIQDALDSVTDFSQIQQMILFLFYTYFTILNTNFRF